MVQVRPYDEIRKEMREVMGGKGISARQLMEDTGISHVTINNFLNGRVKTYEAIVIKLCLHLGLKWDCTVPDEVAA